MSAFADLARMYRFNYVILDMAVKEYSAADWTHRPEGGGNPAHWLLGHIAYCRRTILEMLGEEADSSSLKDSFGRGSKPGDSFTLPTDELREEFKQSGRRIAALLNVLSDEDAAKDVGHEMPDGSTTLGGTVQFMHLHETLHLGQLQYLSRCMGKAGIP